MNRSNHRLGLALWTTVILGVLWLGLGDRLLTHWAYAVQRGRLQATSEELADIPEIAGLQSISKAFRMVAKVARPGVVHINVSGGRFADAPDSEFERLREQLKDFLSKEQLEQLRGRRMPPSSASGIIFDADGYILTNNHVVAGRNKITVQLCDQRTYEARLVGADSKTDLAVIQIDAADLHALKFGDSDKADVGDWVVAVGAPFGLTQTVTHGIVSAVGRTRVLGIDIDYQNFIQTDAAINPGNSGGPLLNLRGEVLGVNTAIATHGDTFNAGVAFTIPSNMAAKIAKQLIADGEVTRGWLGISYPSKPLTEEDVEIFKLPNTNGILVSSVHEDSPGEQGGLLVDDVIVAVNGEPVRNGDYFKAMIADLAPKERVTLRVIRDSRAKDIKVQLGLQPRDLRVASTTPAVQGRDIAALGLQGRALYPGLHLVYTPARFYDETERGVIVGKVNRSDANRKVRPGEVIVACEGKPVSSVGELLAVLKNAAGKKRIRLQILEPNGDRRIIHVERRPQR